MRIALYNQMFALNGKSLVSNLAGHWAVHYQKNEKRIWKRTDINRTANIIKKSRADIAGITEILEGQEKELKEKLEGIGYKHVFFGKGHRTKFRKLHVQVAIASKIKCRQVNLKGFPVENKMGGGGGIIHCYLPGSKTDIINVHLACVKKGPIEKQIKFLHDYLRKINNKIILIGDFNLQYADMENYFNDLDLTLVSDKIKTCCLTPCF